jgi:hypothetical protein
VHQPSQQGRIGLPQLPQVKKSVLEAGVIAALEKEVLSPEAVQSLARRVHQAITQAMEGSSRLEELQQREREASQQIDNLVSFIASGKQSEAVSKALSQAESTLACVREELAAESRRGGGQEPPSLSEIAKCLTSLGDTLQGDPAKAQQALRAVVKEIVVIPQSYERRGPQTAKVKSDLAAALSPIRGRADGIVPVVDNLPFVIEYKDGSILAA